MNLRTGSLAGALPMSMVFFASIVFAMQSMHIAEGLSDTTTTEIDELGRVVTTKSTNGMYFYDYVGQVASYSVQNKTRMLGLDGGGSSVTWNQNTVDGSGPVGSISSNLQSSADSYFQSQLSSSLNAGDCDLNNQDFGLTVPPYSESEDKLGISDLVTASSAVMTTCFFSDGNVRFKSDGLEAVYNATDNRYYQLVRETINFLQELDTELQTVSNSYTGKSNKVCGSPSNSDYNDAMTEAKNDAESDMTSALSTVVTNREPILESMGIKLVTATITGPSDSLSYGVTTSKFEADKTNTWSTSGSCCNTKCTSWDQYGNCINTVCTDDWHWAHAEIWPKKSEVKLRLKDVRYTVPTETSWDRLVFEVDPYTHDYTND